MIWLTVSLIGLWFATIWLFVGLSHAKSLIEQERLGWFWRVNLWPALGLFLVLDVAWNVVIGTVNFVELPRELLFTSRVARHMASDGWRGKVASWWREQLNQIDPGHV